MKRSNRRLLLASLLATSALASACPPPWAVHERHERRDDHRDERHDNRGERHDDRHDNRDERHDDRHDNRDERRGDRYERH